jgi:hypothetical protein
MRITLIYFILNTTDAYGRVTHAGIMWVPNKSNFLLKNVSDYLAMFSLLLRNGYF